MADENIKQAIVDRLRLDGHVIWYIVEMEPGVSDDVVLDLANKESALLLTADKDFGELVFRLGRVASGVILVRFAGLPNSSKATIISEAIARHSDDLPGAFTVITPTTVRIRSIGA
ncbi:MAG: hypothetical protein F6K40_05725 [Okeania sp. SIO3I5]|uniref:DUF5615 family PIN-like protein n=1 Tax=Okeania sp. SIO3I5 TaxID=2607805 RepID=UPI0013BC0175|nr:DUF5615 family PIN-like protein [Okeania sp. SIO3I5]NEQ35809.1 hypothetical protein [Okeania sp. SIO3I5]